MRRVIVETDRLLMVTTKDEDITILHKIIYSDKEVTKYTTGRVFSFAETKEFMHKMFTYDGILGFAPIIEKASNKIIGYGGILEFDLYNQPNCYEFGYLLQKPSWGLGYATEIAKAQIKKIKQEFNNPKIFATVHPQNRASQKVLQKIGMSFIDSVIKSRGLRDVYFTD